MTTKPEDSESSLPAYSTARVFGFTSMTDSVSEVFSAATEIKDITCS